MADETKKDVIIDIKVSDADAMRQAVAFQRELERLKNEQRQLNEQRKKGEITEEQYAKALIKNKEAQRQASASVKAFTKEALNAEGSLEKMRGQLKELVKQYDQLSKAEREGAKGTELTGKIKGLTDSLMEAEAATGRFGRNVGNYPSAFDASAESLQRFGGILAQVMGPATGNAVKAVGTLGTSVKALGKEFLTLLANPIVATFAALAVVVLKVAAAFKRNDEAMTNLNKAFAAFRPVLDIVNRGFDLLADVVGKVVGGIATFVGKIASAIPVVKDYAAANMELVDAQEALRDKEIETNEAIAENEAKISELRAKSTEKSKYSVEERRKMLEKALQLEEDNLKMRKEYARDALETAEKEVMQTYHLRGRYADLTQEQLDKIDDAEKKRISDLRVNLINTETAFNDGTRKLKKQLEGFDTEEKAAVKAAASTAKERAKAQQAAIRELEDALLASVTDATAKALAAVRVAGERRIADLRARLKEEKNLTATARKAISDLIIVEEARLQLRLEDVRKQARKAEEQKRLADLKQYYTNLLATLSDGDGRLEVAIAIADIEAETVKAALYADADMLRAQAEEAAREIAADMDPAAIAAKWSDAFAVYGIDAAKDANAALLQLQQVYDNKYLEEKQRADNNAALVDKAAQQRRLKLRLDGDNALEALATRHADLMAQIEDERALQQFRGNELEKARIAEDVARRRLEVSKSTAEKIASYSEAEAVALYGSIKEWENAVAEAQLAVVKGQGEVQEATIKTNQALVEQQGKTIQSATAIGDAFATIAGGLQSLFSQAAEDNEQFADFATAMALMQILVSTAISIANAIQGATAAAAATGPGAPIATPAFIAEMVGIVAGAMISATSTLMQAKSSKPSTPRFSHGGPVEGRGTDTSDNIHAMLSPGEFVVRAAAARRHRTLLEAINNGGGGGGSRYAGGGWVSSSSIDTAREEQMVADAMRAAMKELRPVVSVQEITRAQERVAVKERIGNWTNKNL